MLSYCSMHTERCLRSLLTQYRAHWTTYYRNGLPHEMAMECSTCSGVCHVVRTDYTRPCYIDTWLSQVFCMLSVRIKQERVTNSRFLSRVDSKRVSCASQFFMSFSVGSCKSERTCPQAQHPERWLNSEFVKRMRILTRATRWFWVLTTRRYNAGCGLHNGHTIQGLTFFTLTLPWLVIHSRIISHVSSQVPSLEYDFELRG